MGFFNKIIDIVADKMADRALGLDTSKTKKIEEEFERSTAYPMKIEGVRYENRMEVVKRMSKNTPICIWHN